MKLPLLLSIVRFLTTLITLFLLQIPQTDWETHNVSATAQGVRPKRRKRSIQETSAGQQSIQVCLSLHRYLSIVSLLGLDRP